MTATGQDVVVDPETSPVRATLIVATMCLAVVVIIGGVASLNVAIPTIGQELQASTTAVTPLAAA